MDGTLLFSPLQLPCGAALRNRIFKAPMSDALGTGRGTPSDAQVNLYRIWADGGAALLVVGEVQIDPMYPENPGNLVLSDTSSIDEFATLCQTVRSYNTHLWAQLGHAGPIAHRDVCEQPLGPSPFDRGDFRCRAITLSEIDTLPATYATAALNAKQAGFSGVHLHAAHGFLLSQFLSPLLNRRTDRYGGSTVARFRLVDEVIKAIRAAVGHHFPIGIKINSTDELDGSLQEPEALEVVRLLDSTSIDLVEISGGTYIPGFDRLAMPKRTRPYFLSFARAARGLTTKPIVLSGGFREYEQVMAVLESGVIDAVSMARALILSPKLPANWEAGHQDSPQFPRFVASPPGGITAWFTELLAEIATTSRSNLKITPAEALVQRSRKDQELSKVWNRRFRDIGAP